MRKLLKIVGIFAVASVFFTASLVTYDFLKTRGVFPSKTYIGRVEVSSLTLEEAVNKLKSVPPEQAFTPLITLEVEAIPYAYAPSKLGIFILPEESAKRAFEMTHKENLVEDLRGRVGRDEVFAPLVMGIDETKLNDVLTQISKEVRSTPKDASIIYYEETGGYNIEADDPGRELNIEKSAAAFKEAFYRGERSIPVVIDYAYARITEKDLRAHPPVYRLSAYTTYYGKHDSPNRIHNIRLIASWIDGVLLMPGDTFSVADALGDVTPEKGFKEAFVIVGGELVPLLGGGSCQIATTLYNAAAIADLKVLQRRNHSFYFNIYPLGRDAGVYPGQLDFKFENDTSYPILIKAVATNIRLSFRLYGTPSGKKVEFSSPSVLGKSESGEFVPMALKQVIDQDIPFKTMVTRTVYDKEGNKIKEEIIRSLYKLYGEKENVPIKRPEPR